MKKSNNNYYEPSLIRIKSRAKVFGLFILLITTILSCQQKDDTTPSVSRLSFGDVQISDVNLTAATLEIEIKNFTTNEVSDFGFVWAETSNPVIGTNNQKSLGTIGINTYRHTITSLKSNTQYYVRGYFAKADGVTYSDEVSFTTSQLTFEALNPNSSGIGDEITLIGQNFSTNISDNQVNIGGIVSTVISVSATRDSLTVKVPDGLNAWESTKVQVIVGNDIVEKDAALLITGWIRKNDFGGRGNGLAAGFTINDKGYVVGGVGEFGAAFEKGTWEYDPANDQWTRKKDHPEGISFHEGFSAGGKGYVSWGNEHLWQYDPISDTWVEKFKGTSSTRRYYAFSFNVGDNFITGGGIVSSTSNEVWLYDTFNETWTKQNNAPFDLWHAVSFTIGADVYVTGGSVKNNTDNPSKSLWLYQSGSDTWVQKADFAGTARTQSVAFSDERNRKGYVGLGYDGTNFYKDMWQYNQMTNSWTQVPGELNDNIANPTVLKINERVFLVGGATINNEAKRLNITATVREFIFPKN